ncbi:MAG: AtpZ/AtpI family protein [Planctomycetes bacterium]|nr:AtpZ/AtpI family protein [Planctomycetota bacterium]
MATPERNPNRVLALAGVGISFAAIVGLSTWGGMALDDVWGTEPWLTLACGMTGVGLAIWDLVRTVDAFERKGKS